MSWMDQIGNILEQYAGANAQAAPGSARDDFDQVAQAAPRTAMADGLAAAFRSDQTPPFAQMVAQLFRNSNGQQRAGLLNTLLASVGPGLLAQVLGQGGVPDLQNVLQSGRAEVTPQQAEQIAPEAVEQIAAQAENQNPSIVDRLSDFYAEHPQLVTALGTAAVTLALRQLAKRRMGE
jgi:hypothetical protein